METQLARFGYQDRIVRFAAVNGIEEGPFDNAGKNGIWACRQSHEQVIANAAADTATVVLEDDVELSALFPTLINEQVLSTYLGNNSELDLLILDCCPMANSVARMLLEAERRMKGRADPQLHGDDRYHFDNVSLLDARDAYGFCSAAYIVTPKGKRTLRALFSSMEDKAVAVDMLFRHWLQFGGLSAQLIIPFVATPKYMSASTISYDVLESPVIDETVGKALSGIRRLLFAGESGLDMNEINALIGAGARSPEYKLGVELAAVVQATS
jgi:hypothetical protein